MKVPLNPELAKIAQRQVQWGGGGLLHSFHFGPLRFFSKTQYLQKLGFFGHMVQTSYNLFMQIR